MVETEDQWTFDSFCYNETPVFIRVNFVRFICLVSVYDINFNFIIMARRTFLSIEVLGAIKAETGQ